MGIRFYIVLFKYCVDEFPEKQNPKDLRIEKICEGATNRIDKTVKEKGSRSTTNGELKLHPTITF